MQTTLPSNVMQILNDAYVFSVRHYKQIATLCLPFLFAATLFDFAFARAHQETPMALIGPLMFNLLVYPFYTAALIHLMARRAIKDEPSNKALLMAAVHQWLPLFILKTMLILIIGLGISLLILPGIYLGIRLAFAEFYLVLFGDRSLDAIRKSFVATRPHFLNILVLLSITYVPVLFLGIATDQYIQTLTSNDFFRVIASTGWSLIGLFVNIVLFRAFMDTKELETPT